MKHSLRNYNWIVWLFLVPIWAQAQYNNVGVGTKSPDANAMLEIYSKDKGLLIPRMTSSEKMAIPATPASQGLLVYDTDTQSFWYWDGNSWIEAIGPMGPIGPTGPTGLSNIDSLILKFASFDTVLSQYAIFDSLIASYINVDSLSIGGSNITNLIDSMINAAGVIGPTGAQGPAGANGKDGMTGATGANGKDGKDGVTGATGAQGLAGTNGKDGQNGTTGPTGATGAQGAAGAKGATGATGADGSSNAWGLTGNIGTSSGTNFLGTADAVDFIVKTNNTERLRILSSGNIGIGTTTPSAALMVNGDIKIMYSDAYYLGAYKGLWYNSSSPNVGNVIGTSLSSHNLTVYVGGSYRHIFDNTGNVGIGTISPTQLLHINGNARLTGALYDMNNNPGSSNEVLVSNGNGVYWSSLSAIGAIGPTGITGPTGAAGTAGSKGATGATGPTGMDGSANAWGLTGNAGTTAGTNFLGTTDSQDMVFKTGNTERLRIKSNGYVGIGGSKYTGQLISGASQTLTIAASNSYYAGLEASLELAGSSISTNSGSNGIGKIDFVSLWGTGSGALVNNIARIQTVRGSTPADGIITFSTNDGSTLNEIMRISDEGNVGIGTTNPKRTLHVSDVMRLEPRTSAPSSAAEGDIYYDSTLHKLRVYDGTTWQNCW